MPCYNMLSHVHVVLQSHALRWLNNVRWVFSVTRRSRSDKSHSLTYSCFCDSTDVTLVSEDTY